MNATSDYITNQSSNTTNPNSSLTYLNVNNSTTNVNTNISSQLLSLDSKRITFNVTVLKLPYHLVENKE